MSGLDALRHLPRHYVADAEASALLWGSAVQDAQAAQQVARDGAAFPQWATLLEDVFALYYLPTVQLRAADAVHPDVQGHRPIVTQLHDDPATHALRPATAADPLGAAVATVAFARHLLATLREQPAAARALRQPGQAPRDPGRVAQAAHTAACQAQADTQQVQAALAACGVGDRPGAHDPVPLGARLDQAQALLTPRFHALARLIGRLRRLAAARARAAAHRVPDEQEQITLGADLPAIFATEWQGLRHPILRRHVLRQYLDAELLQQELAARETPAWGPLCIATDCSGSTAGEPLDWGIAVTLALAEIARRQRRACAACTFDTRCVATWTWPDAQPPLADLLALARTAAGGGTAFDAPVTWFCDQLATAPFARADLVLLTDGWSRLSDAVAARLAAARAAGARVWVFLVGPAATAAHVAPWADAIQQVQPTDAGADAVFEPVVSGG